MRFAIRCAVRCSCLTLFDSPDMCRGWHRPCSRRVPARLLAVLVFSPRICWFLTRTPAVHHKITATLVQTLIPPQGASRGQYVISFGFCPARVWLCHPTQPDVSPHLTPARRCPPAKHSNAVSQMVSWLRSHSLERHDVWHRIFSYHMPVTQARTYHHPLFLPPSVTPINVLAGATDDCLLHVFLLHVFLLHVFLYCYTATNCST